MAPKLDTVTIRINGSFYAQRAGQNLLEVLRARAVDIPAVCHRSGPHGPLRCGLCLVEIEGEPESRCACEVSIEEGMIVRTQTLRVRRERRERLARIFERHYRPAVCANCIWDGGCELHRLAAEWGVPVARPE